MTEFANCYKSGIDHLEVPDFSMEELGNRQRHQKYVSRKKHDVFLVTMVFILLFSIVASVTAYAAYTIHKKIQYTSHGIKIDASAANSQTDGIIHEYAAPDTPVSPVNTDTIPTYKQQDFMDGITTQEHAEINYFDNWPDALQVIDFPIARPENIPYSELKIAYQTDASSKSAEASYITDDKELIINYTCFLSQNWDFAIDYNAEIVNRDLYTNKYHYDFRIVECQEDEHIQTHVTTSVNNCVIQLSFSNYGTDEIYEILDEFNLSIY